ncbi:MAG: CBS domain-containing protein [Gammaproteobacteria bacterium]|nr:CBS domain-containing protein [Gammaproteobacteria bacterium]
MTKVANLLSEKGKEVWSISPDSMVFDALQLMETREVGALAVVVGDKLVGVVSERDYARKVFLKGRSSKETRVKDIMTEKVFYTTPDKDMQECMAVMTQNHCRHLPVIENKKLVGMVSLGDVVKVILKEQQYKIEHLEQALLWDESY